MAEFSLVSLVGDERGGTHVVEAALERVVGPKLGGESACAVAEGVVEAERVGGVGDGGGLGCLGGHYAV